MDILGAAFSISAGSSPEAKQVMNAYKEMVPEVSSTWPGMGIGLIAVVDQVRKVVMPVVFGQTAIDPWKAFGFLNGQSWWEWCREDHDFAAETHFAFADLLDLTYGLSDLGNGNGKDIILWQMATSNLSDVANCLPSIFSLDTVLQPICMVAELSIKAALVRNGADPDSFRGKGHNLDKLTTRLATEIPHRDDALVSEVVARLPPYVDSRYSPTGLTRLAVVRLALGVQLVAASTVRRFSNRDLAVKMETGDWPAPRRPLFPY